MLTGTVLLLLLVEQVANMRGKRPAMPIGLRKECRLFVRRHCDSEVFPLVGGVELLHFPVIPMLTPQDDSA